jgi:hypothetical protein
MKVGRVGAVMPPVLARVDRLAVEENWKKRGHDCPRSPTMRPYRAVACRRDSISLSIFCSLGNSPVFSFDQISLPSTSNSKQPPRPGINFKSAICCLKVSRIFAVKLTAFGS